MTEDFDIEAPPPEEEGSNRTFMVAVGAIGGLLILSMVCLGVYALVIAPSQAQNREAQATQIVLENTRVAASFTETAQAARPTLVPTQPPPTATSSPTITPTQVVVIATSTPVVIQPTLNPAQATAAAQATLSALQATATATALPSTGFADEVGLPGLLLLGGLLAVVILITRHLRTRSVA
jgi:cytoskeletal protein RodZ